MQIKKLKLYTTSLNVEKKFYSEVLGFDLIEEQPNLFTLKVGWSELTFEQSEIAHSYHYCFLIPSNKLAEALAWMEKRVEVIDLGKGRKIQRFETWNADSFYFFDGSGNIAEFIVRHGLKNTSNSPFKISEVLCVNEIGMPSNKVRQTNEHLHHYFGTEFWKGDLERFATNGTEEGLFLLPNYEIKEFWFPTSIKIKPAPFVLELEHNGHHFAMTFRNEEIKIHEL